MTSPDPTPVTDIAEIDLDRHAVIEASAGTGKTYCIENLVVRLLCEKRVPLEQILLVTFTEKATGDLHERIRQNIIEAIDAGQGDAAVLHQALENFDTACIFTIHGFCQRVLQQYAFENGGSFVLEVVDDGDLYETQLRWQERRDWPATYGDDLEALLELAGYPGTGRDGGGGWDRGILELARRYRPEAGDRLIPETAGVENFRKWDQTVADGMAAVIDLLGLPKSPLGKSKPYWWYKQLRLPDPTRKQRLHNVILPLLEFMDAHRHRPRTVVDFVSLVERCNACRDFDRWGFHVLVNDLNLDGDTAIDDFYDDLCAAIQVLDDLAERVSAGMLANLLAADTVRRLKEAARDHKEEHGLISYDDMLLLVARALNPDCNERAPQLVAQLRHRFRYALVDEFQDTDPVQWEVFQRIFVGGDEQRLFLIGDPKQAIYSFRGADLETYMRATQELLRHHDAAYYSLPVNWRSMPGLVEVLNQLCGTRDWFAPESGVRFLPVSVPPPEQRRARAYADTTQRAALTVVDLNRGERSLSLARRWMAWFIAEEIQRLLQDDKFVIDRHGRPDRLRASDICVLIRKSSEAENVEEFLSRSGIPFAFYKKSGLYQSEEARNLYYLFQAIDNPGSRQDLRKALLTRFFPVAVEELELVDELPYEHPVRRLLRRWHEYAEQRQWPRLFQSVLEDTGILFRENTESDGDRRLTNYRHILQDLEQTAYEENLDFAQLVDRLRNYRLDAALVAEDDNMHRIESEADKVQIMTIHTCKGLEFPVVFLAGGFTANRNNPYNRYHDDNGRVVYDLTKQPEFKDRHEREEAEEDRRLYYVALTRAIHKLYVPNFRPQRNSGWSGPVATFIYDALETAFDRRNAEHVRFLTEAGVELQREPEWTPELDALPVALDQEVAAAVPVPAELLPPAVPSFQHRSRRIGSFSSLAAHAHHPADADSLLDKMTAFAAETELLSDEILGRDDLEEPAMESGANLLPRGADTGSMLHEVFENIDFSTVAAAAGPQDLLAAGSASARLIDQLLRRYSLPPPDADSDAVAWRDDVAGIVFRTLRTPLLDGLELASLAPADRLHELEFLFPVAGPAAVPETTVRNGYLTGYVDLVFRHRERYYILDWKSNYLPDGYGPEQLEAGMTAADYHLQYKVYSVALLRWLARGRRDLDPAAAFGGIFYLYLRGLDGSTNGVYCRQPEATELAAFEREVQEIFGARASA